MGSAAVPNGRRQDHEGGQDSVSPADGLANDDTMAYRLEDDPDATQAIVQDPRYLGDATGYGEDSGYTEEPGDLDPAGAYVEDTGYAEGAGYGEELGYANPAPGFGAALLTADGGAAIAEVVIARQEDRFGGIKVGSAFFGWLSAAGIAVLLVFLVAGMGAGLITGSEANIFSGVVSSPPDGMTGSVVLLSIVFVSLFAGGYVAGRMARFNGAGQGLMVWLWAVIMAGAIVLLSMAAGLRFNDSPTGNGLPGIPLLEGQVSSSELIAIIVAAAVALIAAVLGGIAGMRYHRRVDRVGFTPPAEDEYQT